MRHIAATILSGLILATPLSGFAQSDTTFPARCNFAKGDPIAKVKEFYGIDFEPQKLAAAVTLAPVRPIGWTAFQYHLEQYGVWVFFDDHQDVSSLRFDAPFRGQIGGIAIGDDVASVRSLHGERERQMQGFADEDAKQRREQRMRDIIDALPDPAPKQRVLDAFIAALTLVREPTDFTTAWIYNAGTPSFVSYHISINNKVQNILANACPQEK